MFSLLDQKQRSMIFYGEPKIQKETLRKTYGRFYYLKTHDISMLMYLFNHSSEKITKRYIGIADDAKSSLEGFRIGVKGGEM